MGGSSVSEVREAEPAAFVALEHTVLEAAAVDPEAEEAADAVDSNSDADSEEITN